jgi:tetratricopeptide (TPR) repeat protein
VLPKRLASTVADPVGFGQTLGALRRYSLVTVTTEAISTHRLVQAVVRHGLAAELANVWAATAVGLVGAGFPDQPEDVGVWPVAARLLPHALAATDHAGGLDADPRATAGLLHQAGRYLWGRAEPTQAKTLHQRALAIRETQLGPSHLDTGYSHQGLGVVLHAQGDLAGARRHYERALVIHEARLGADHPDTAYSLNNLGGVLYDRGDLAGTRALYERALAIREARLGADHPTTAYSLNNLAVVLHNQGDLDGARALHERALRSARRALALPTPPLCEAVSILRRWTRRWTIGDSRSRRPSQQSRLWAAAGAGQAASRRFVQQPVSGQRRRPPLASPTTAARWWWPAGHGQAAGRRLVRVVVASSATSASDSTRSWPSAERSRWAGTIATPWACRPPPWTWAPWTHSRGWMRVPSSRPSVSASQRTVSRVRSSGCGCARPARRRPAGRCRSTACCQSRRRLWDL